MGLMLLPAPPGTCKHCATKHGPRDPHNHGSIFYQMRFKMEHGRDATQADCVAHLPEGRQTVYRQILSEYDKEWTEPSEPHTPIAEAP